MESHSCAFSLRKLPVIVQVDNEADVPAEYKTVADHDPAAAWDRHLEVCDDKDGLLAAVTHTEVKLDRRALLAKLKTGAEWPARTSLGRLPVDGEVTILAIGYAALPPDIAAAAQALGKRRGSRLLRAVATAALSAVASHSGLLRTLDGRWVRVGDVGLPDYAIPRFFLWRNRLMALG